VTEVSCSRALVTLPASTPASQVSMCLRQMCCFCSFKGMIGVNLHTKRARFRALNKAMSFVFKNFLALNSAFLYNSFLFKYFLASFRLPGFYSLCFQ
jgi:hypothetical protein